MSTVLNLFRRKGAPASAPGSANASPVKRSGGVSDSGGSGGGSDDAASAAALAGASSALAASAALTCEDVSGLLGKRLTRLRRRHKTTASLVRQLGTSADGIKLRVEIDMQFFEISNAVAPSAIGAVDRAIASELPHADAPRPELALVRAAAGELARMLAELSDWLASYLTDSGVPPIDPSDPTSASRYVRDTTVLAEARRLLSSQTERTRRLISALDAPGGLDLAAIVRAGELRAVTEVQLGADVGVYRGEVDSAARPHGLGLVLFARGGYYDGEWKAGLRHGFGRYATGAGDSVFEGMFAHDRPAGKGTLRLGVKGGSSATGPRAVYSGSVIARTAAGERGDGTLARYDVLRHGRGTYVEGPGTDGFASMLFVGEWANDRKHGFGVMRIAGSRGSPGFTLHYGTWQTDELSGRVLTVGPDGATFAGEYRAGKRHGAGTLMSPTGTAVECVWKGDALAQGRLARQLHVDQLPSLSATLIATALAERARLTAGSFVPVVPLVPSASLDMTASAAAAAALPASTFCKWDPLVGSLSIETLRAGIPPSVRREKTLRTRVVAALSTPTHPLALTIRQFHETFAALHGVLPQTAAPLAAQTAAAAAAAVGATAGAATARRGAHAFRVAAAVDDVVSFRSLLRRITLGVFERPTDSRINSDEWASDVLDAIDEVLFAPIFDGLLALFRALHADADARLDATLWALRAVTPADLGVAEPLWVVGAQRASVSMAASSADASAAASVAAATSGSAAPVTAVKAAPASMAALAAGAGASDDLETADVVPPLPRRKSLPELTTAVPQLGSSELVNAGSTGGRGAEPGFLSALAARVSPRLHRRQSVQREADAHPADESGAFETSVLFFSEDSAETGDTRANDAGGSEWPAFVSDERSDAAAGSAPPLVYSTDDGGDGDGSQPATAVGAPAAASKGTAAAARAAPAVPAAGAVAAAATAAARVALRSPLSAQATAAAVGPRAGLCAPVTRPYCAHCAESLAHVFCFACAASHCADCSHVLHRAPSLRAHHREPVWNESSGSASPDDAVPFRAAIERFRRVATLRSPRALVQGLARMSTVLVDTVCAHVAASGSRLEFATQEKFPVVMFVVVRAGVAGLGSLAALLTAFVDEAADGSHFYRVSELDAVLRYVRGLDVAMRDESGVLISPAVLTEQLRSALGDACGGAESERLRAALAGPWRWLAATLRALGSRSVRNGYAAFVLNRDDTAAALAVLPHAARVANAIGLKLNVLGANSGVAREPAAGLDPTRHTVALEVVRRYPLHVYRELYVSCAVADSAAVEA